MRAMFLFVVAGMVVVSNDARAEDQLQKLLARPSCKELKSIRQATHERFKTARTQAEINLIEQAFTVLEACLDEKELARNSGAFAVTGIEATKSRLKLLAQIYSSLVIFHRAALKSNESATSQASWPNLAQSAVQAMNEIPVVIDLGFGPGSYAKYMLIAKQPEDRRSAQDQAFYLSVHEWIAPL